MYRAYPVYTTVGLQMPRCSTNHHLVQGICGNDYIDSLINTLRQRQDGRHFADDIFKCIFLNENAWILIKISLKFIPKGPINNIPSLVQIMVWLRPCTKPLSEPMMVSLLIQICVTRPQWVNSSLPCTQPVIHNNIPFSCSALSWSWMTTENPVVMTTQFLQSTTYQPALH